ncbi:MAG TPA: ribosome-associated translation inhibitor RaiA [Pseudonocardiaceae bacterium]|jgi:ribosomal subunit interface protein|nr:ribosome-associated translation inhibitor RaiA [Pseudonocardiaceae bacterium]
MDIVVKGRNVEVPEHYRVHVTEKLSRLERYDRKIVRFDVELFHEPNRRQHKSCQRVEITTQVRGQVICAVACAGDFYGALDCATSKLESRLRRIHDRRRVHYGRRSPASVGAAVGAATPTMLAEADVSAEAEYSALAAQTAVLEVNREPEERELDAPRIPEQRWSAEADEYQPGRIVREKKHTSDPMSVESALSEMELVGHDFYLFTDADCGLPSVVYRRKGFDYGLIRLA